MEKSVGRKKDKKQEAGTQGIWMGVAKGVLVALLVTVVCYVVTAVLLVQTNLSEGAVGWISLVVTAVASFLAGFTAAKEQQKGGLWWGIGTALIYFCVVVALLFLCGNAPLFTLGRLPGLLCAIGGGGLGGILGINKKK